MTENQSPSLFLLAALGLIGALALGGLLWFGFGTMFDSPQQSPSSRTSSTERSEAGKSHKVEPFLGRPGTREWQAHRRGEKQRIKRMGREAQQVAVKVARRRAQSGLSIDEVISNPTKMNDRWVTLEGRIIYPHWEPGDLTDKGQPSLVSDNDFQEEGREVSFNRQIELSDYSDQLADKGGTRVRVTGKLLVADMGPVSVRKLSRRELEEFRQKKRAAKKRGNPRDVPLRIVENGGDKLLVEFDHRWDFHLSVKSFQVLDSPDRSQPSISLSEDELTPENFDPERPSGWEYAVLDEGGFVKELYPEFTEFANGDLGLVWVQRRNNEHLVKFSRFSPGDELGNIPGTVVTNSPKKISRVRLAAYRNRPLLLFELEDERTIALASSITGGMPRGDEWEVHRLAGNQFRGGDITIRGKRLVACAVDAEREAGYFLTSSGEIPEGPDGWKQHKVISKDMVPAIGAMEHDASCAIRIYQGRPVILWYVHNEAESFLTIADNEDPKSTSNWNIEDVISEPLLADGPTKVPLFIQWNVDTYLIYPDTLSEVGNMHQVRITEGGLWHRGSYFSGPEDFRIAWGQRRNLSDENRIKYRGSLTVSRVRGPADKAESWKHEVVDRGFKNREWSLRLGEESDLIRAGGYTLVTYLRCVFRNRVKQGQVGGERVSREVVDYSDCELVVARGE